MVRTGKLNFVHNVASPRPNQMLAFVVERRGTVSVACCVRSRWDMGTCWRRQRRANRMQFGEPAVPVSSSTGSTSVSVRNQQHVDLLGRGLELSLFRPKRNCVVLVSATSSASSS